MRSTQVGRSATRRVRFVFDDDVVSFSVSAATTYGEIARMFGDVLDGRVGGLVAIDVMHVDADACHVDPWWAGNGTWH